MRVKRAMATDECGAKRDTQSGRKSYFPSGRFAVAIGVGGAGKTTLLRPLVEAWTNPEEGLPREVYGTALAWRQSDPLADAGIKPGNAMAITALLARGDAGKLNLGADT